MEWKPSWLYHPVTWGDLSTSCRYDFRIILLFKTFHVSYRHQCLGGLTSVTLWFQSTSMAYGKVTEDTVYTCTGHPLRSDIANILDWSLNKDFTASYKRILVFQVQALSRTRINLWPRVFILFCTSQKILNILKKLFIQWISFLPQIKLTDSLIELKLLNLFDTQMEEKCRKK